MNIKSTGYHWQSGWGKKISNPNFFYAEIELTVGGGEAGNVVFMIGTVSIVIGFANSFSNDI